LFLSKSKQKKIINRSDDFIIRYTHKQSFATMICSSSLSLQSMAYVLVRADT